MSNNHEKSPPRREFLRKTLALIPLSAAITSPQLFATENSAKDKDDAGRASISSHYVPTYFNNDEWAFLLAACDRLIPSDENGPGAVAEDVPVYIDKQMEAPYGHGNLWYMQGPFVDNAPPELGYQSKLTPRETLRIGIKATDEYCKKHFNNKIFSNLTGEQQDEVLHALEKNGIELDGVSAQQFFNQLWQNTKEGYLADPIHGGNQSMASWRLIGFPGARADFTDWVNHPNKPYPLGPVSISSKRNN